eukprot:3598919-Rhodomonas_salina.1
MASSRVAGGRVVVAATVVGVEDVAEAAHDLAGRHHRPVISQQVHLTHAPPQVNSFRQSQPPQLNFFRPKSTRATRHLYALALATDLPDLISALDYHVLRFRFRDPQLILVSFLPRDQQGHTSPHGRQCEEAGVLHTTKTGP